jgi:hypothetical protein
MQSSSSCSGIVFGQSAIANPLDVIANGIEPIPVRLNIP